MTDTTPAAAVQIPAAGIYQLDPAASTVTFATRHMFGLAPVKGTFRLVSGQITLTLAFMTALAWRSSFADAPTACGAIAEPLLRRRAASTATSPTSAGKL